MNWCRAKSRLRWLVYEPMMPHKRGISSVGFRRRLRHSLPALIRIAHRWSYLWCLAQLRVPEYDDLRFAA